jgi:adenylate cyclase
VLAAALQYLLVEQAMRPITARALSGAVPSGELTPGVTARLVMAWTVGAGVPLVVIAAVGATASLGRGLSRDRVAGACAVLALIGVLAGSLAIRLASRSVAIPLYGLRDGLASVAAGRLDQTVRVDDGSEVGRLQAGFNSMIEGLRDRQRLHDAFGSYVDPDLTRRILTEGVDLAGEEIELSVMFIDVRDFTVFAEATPAREVVAQLNSLYAVIIPIITRNGGHASKFVGDGLLAVFGAPRRLDHHADDAVRCAIEMVDAVSTDATIGLQVGIGVNSGSVVVGTVGGGGRRDFTVIGDTVNTAARVESATRQTGDDILITDSTRRLLTVHGEWRARPLVQLKGKSGSVTLYAPEQ